MSSWFDPKKLTIIAAIVVALAVAAIIALLTFVKPINPAHDNLTKTEINTAAVSIIPDGKLASVMATPATPDWWARLNQFSPVSQLRNVDFAALPAAPTSLGWSLSAGQNYRSTEYLGLNTIYIQTNSAEEAEKNREFIFGLVGEKVRVIASGNMVLIIPIGAYSDVELNLEAYQSLKENKNNESAKEAVWSVNFAELTEVLSVGEEAQKTVWSDMITAFGAKKATESVYWAGTSEDGLSWKGDLSADNLWAAAAISSVDLQKAAAGNDRMYLPDGTEVTAADLEQIQKEALAAASQSQENTGEEPLPGIASDVTSVYIVDAGTSDALYSMLVRNSGTAFGSMAAVDLDPEVAVDPEQDIDTVVTASKLADDTNYTEVTVNPNTWISAVVQPYASPSIYVLFDQLTVKLYNNSTDMDITLRVAPWADSIDNIGAWNLEHTSPAEGASNSAPEDPRAAEEAAGEITIPEQ